MLKITVAGHCASGKTTIAHLIATILNFHGIKTEVKDADPIPTNIVGAAHSLAKKYDEANPVGIETVQLNREWRGQKS